jgi:uncharacterized protein YecE (DUF72 family)
MLRIGTCSWKYPSWEGLVYSRSAGIDYLAEYARRYDTVEVDQWFWAPPEPATAAQYASVVPGDFRFTVKLPNTLSLTHFYRKRGETALRANAQFLSVTHYEEILERLQPLHGKIGMLMLQFEYLNGEKMRSQAAFLDALGSFAAAAPRTLPLAIELRNPRWIDERYARFLQQAGFHHVFLEGYFMSPVPESWKRIGSLLQGAAVVRLHGPDRDGMEKVTGETWNRIVSPKDDLLDRIAAMINDMTDRSLTVYLNVNNHFEGSAPLTIQRLRERGVRAGRQGE